MIHVTVLLPIYKAREIAPFAMESLCRQETSLNWELIIMEEECGAAGEYFFERYRDRMEDAGMKQMRYLPIDERPGILQKVLMGAIMAEGDYLAKHDADNYHDASWLNNVIQMDDEGADIWSSKKGYFYNLETGEMYRHDYTKESTCLSEIYRAKMLMETQYTTEPINRDITYIWNNNKGAKHLQGTGNYIYTEGRNHVYTDRGVWGEEETIRYKRSKSEKNLEELMPAEVAKWVRETNWKTKKEVVK